MAGAEPTDLQMKSKFFLNHYHQQKQWFSQLGQIRGSVIPAIFPKVCFCMLFSLIISRLYLAGINLAVPVKSGLIPSIVLGLLLVFRTNTAYDRFWEGRKLWGNLVNTVRNLSRSIWVTIGEKSCQDRRNKEEVLRLLVAFCISMKLYLRGEKVNQELEASMTLAHYQALKDINHPPLEIAFWISDYLHQQLQQHRVNPYQFNAMLRLLDQMVDSLGACERILKTPMPLAYAIHLKQLVFIYCLSLPFELVDQLLWLTAPVVGLVSFAIFGIEEIGAEIENPFGYDANDLPLDDICCNIQHNIEDLMKF